MNAKFFNDAASYLTRHYPDCPNQIIEGLKDAALELTGQLPPALYAGFKLTPGKRGGPAPTWTLVTVGSDKDHVGALTQKSAAASGVGYVVRAYTLSGEAV